MSACVAADEKLDERYENLLKLVQADGTDGAAAAAAGDGGGGGGSGAASDANVSQLLRDVRFAVTVRSCVLWFPRIVCAFMMLMTTSDVLAHTTTGAKRRTNECEFV